MTSPESIALAEQHGELENRLTLIADDPELDESQRDLARAWKQHIENKCRVATAPLSVAFLSAIGCGKSSMIAAIAGLRLAGQADDPASWSVLPVAEGRTTLGELRVELEERGDLGLEIEPMPADDLELEIRLFARDRFDIVNGRVRQDLGSGGEELRELLRAWLAPDAEDRWDALDQEAKAAESAEALEHSWLARVDLDARSRDLERTFDHDDAGLRSLRDTLRDGFAGTLAVGPIPQRTTLRVPRPAAMSDLAALIDTQGIDLGAVPLPARADIQRLLQDDDVLFVVCSEFNTAPDEPSKEVLEFLREALDLQELAERVLGLLIVDKRRKGSSPAQRDTRIRQCREQLQRAQLSLSKPELSVVSFDVRSEASQLQEFLHGEVGRVRDGRLLDWRRALNRASNAIATLHEIETAKRLRTIDLELWWAWDAFVANAGGESLDGLQGLSKTLQPWFRFNHHWSQLHAAARRRGQYGDLDLAHIGALGVVVFAGPNPINAARELQKTARQLGKDVDDAIAQHLAMRVEQFLHAAVQQQQETLVAWRGLLSAYFKSPQARPLWAACIDRWGEGPGYVEAIARLMANESTKARLSVSIPSIESRMPERPRLFLLRKVRLQNFRGIRDQTIALAPAVTAIIGDNGLGKTAWLEALAAAVGLFLPGVGAGPAPQLTEADVRATLQMMGGVPDRQPQPPLAIEVEATVEGRAIEWARRIDTLPLGPDQNNSEGALQVLAAKAGEDVRAHAMRQLPVLAYYGTQRLWPPDIEAANGLGGNRLDGYRDCLQAASTHQHLLSWMHKHTYAQIQNKRPYPQLQAIEHAVVSCVEGAAAFRFQIELDQLVIEMADGQCLTLGMLSDGYRNIVAMVADIAWRACTLNPHLREHAPKLAEGVVLIDEIDLHLHPNWQKRVLSDLCRAFPRLQFVVTTHSPFIVQSLRDGQLVNLDDSVIGGAYANESPEDIAERQMGVEVPQRSERRRREYEVATRYYELLDRMPAADPVELARIKAELDEIVAPYADNQAFVALLERKRMLQEGQCA